MCALNDRWSIKTKKCLSLITDNGEEYNKSDDDNVLNTLYVTIALILWFMLLFKIINKLR